MAVKTKATIFSQVIKFARQGEVDKASDLVNALKEQANSHAPLSDTETRLLDSLAQKFALKTNRNPNTSTKRVPPAIQSQRSGISLVTCAMNRTENLLSALPTWLAQSDIDEIIIVDWSSHEPVLEAIRAAGLDSTKIRIVRALDESKWVLSYAFNLGFRCARFDKILKVDADITLSKNFFQANSLGESEFITGFWELAPEGQAHINGFFFVHSIHLASICGFNEYITTYGWDDDDIYDRLAGLGLHRKSVDVHSIYHIEHDDEQRLGQKQKESRHAFDEIRLDTMFSIRRNRFIAQTMPKWKAGSKFAPFEILGDDGKTVEVRRLLADMSHLVRNEWNSVAENYALREILSWKLGSTVFQMSDRALHVLLQSKQLAELTSVDVDDAAMETTNVFRTAPLTCTQHPKLFVDAQHGLGNRLRAIASGAVLAKELEKELVVIWQPDHHCDCRFEDIVDFPGTVLDQSFPQAAELLGISVFNYMETEGGTKNEPIERLPGDIYFRSAFTANSDLTDAGKENAYLKTLVPSEAVSALIRDFDLRDHIAVHVRMEAGAGLDHQSYDSADNWSQEDHDLLHYWREKSDYRRFINHIDAIIETDPSTKLFLATDMQSTYDAFESCYGERLTYLKRDVYDRSREQIIYAMADAILLSRCKRFVGSTWSSFSEIAMRLTNGYSSIEMSGEDF